MILFDTPREDTFRGRTVRTAHLVSDLADPIAARAELDAFAERLGLRRKWIQYPGQPKEHYDLFDSRIERAREAGAREVSQRELVERVVQPRRARARVDWFLRTARREPVEAGVLLTPVVGDREIK